MAIPRFCPICRLIASDSWYCFSASAGWPISLYATPIAWSTLARASSFLSWIDRLSALFSGWSDAFGSPRLIATRPTAVRPSTCFGSRATAFAKCSCALARSPVCS